MEGFTLEKGTQVLVQYFSFTFFHEVNHIKLSFHLLWFAVLLIMEYFKILRLLQAKGFEFTTYMHMLGTQ